MGRFNLHRRIMKIYWYPYIDDYVFLIDDRFENWHLYWLSDNGDIWRWQAYTDQFELMAEVED